MSRAFVKEADGEQAEGDLPERPHSSHPNYISTKGLERLRAKLNTLSEKLRKLKNNDSGISSRNEIKQLEVDLRYLEKRIESAIPVLIRQQPDKDIRFGATVSLVDEDDHHYTVTIVGEDEVDIDKNKLSWVSPLPRALIGKGTGDLVTWQRPDGDLELEIIGFSYAEYI